MDRSQAAIFCAPSVTTRSGETEAFEIVFAEAQALQKPVVSFASGGIPEAVAHNETGLLAPERDRRHWQPALQPYCRIQTCGTALDRAGRQRTLRLFDLKKQTCLLEDNSTKVSAKDKSLSRTA